MLYNPQWDRPTVTRFVRFLKDQNPQDTYNWMDPRRCACAQFYGGGDWIVRNRDVRRREGIDLNRIAYDGEWTFGALLERLETVIAR